VSKNVLTICFSLILAFNVGCSTLNGSNNKWPTPIRPSKLPVELIPMAEVPYEDTGYYLSNKDALNLVENVEDLKAYIEKLEVQIRTMKKYYGDK